MSNAETIAKAMSDLNDLNGAAYRLRSDLNQLRKTDEEPTLNHLKWNALNVAERKLYGINDGCNAYTDVVPHGPDAYLCGIWEQCEMSVDGEYDAMSETGTRFSDLPYRVQHARVAHRVAQALAVIAFGPEILLK